MVPIPTPCFSRFSIVLLFSQMDEDLEEIPTDTDPEADAIFDDALKDAALDFDASLKKKLDDAQYKKLRTVGALIMRGLSLEESCILARVNPTSFSVLMQHDSDVSDFIIFKQISYKADLLKTISSGAISGRQVKTAGYLLEKKFPHEYDKKKGEGDPGKQRDIVAEAIKFVRENSDAHPLVHRLSAPDIHA